MEETYVSTTVVTAPVGTGPGEIGLYRGEDGQGSPQFAANVFRLDEQGNIYIVDDWNQRVVEFDRAGNFVLDIPWPPREGEPPGKLAVDAQGRVYIEGASGLLQPFRLLDRAGHVLREYPFPSWFSEPWVEEMYVDSEGILWVQGTADESYPALVLKGNPYYRTVTVPLGTATEVFDEEEQRAMAMYGELYPNGQVVVQDYCGRDCLIVVYTSQGQPLFQYNNQFGLLGIDRSGSIFLEDLNLDTGGSTVMKFSPQGKQVAFFASAACFHGNTVIGPDAKVYCLFLDRQTLHTYYVVRWWRSP